MKTRSVIFKISIIRIIWILGEHAFFFTLALIGIGVLISVLLFRVYVLPIETQSGTVSSTILKFQKNIFQEVSGDWDAQNKKFLESPLAPREIFRYNSSVLKAP